jgi:hypothetical protein
MTVGYWVKRDIHIDIGEELHASAIVRKPSRFGISTDLVTFAFDQSEIGNDPADPVLEEVLHSGWIKVRRYILQDTEHWSVVCASFSRSGLEICRFIRTATLSASDLRAASTMTLEGVEDGFFQEISSRDSNWPKAIADMIYELHRDLP